jgi:hypothetical protein
MGMVVSVPMRKKATANSLNEVVNVVRSEAIRAGIVSGSVTRSSVSQ